jgi:glutathione-independent formaldehyde dehydrogenase
MPDENKVVVYQGPGKVSVEPIDYPKLEIPKEVAEGMGIQQDAPHGAILKVVSTNICGSDQHMVRGRTTAPEGQTLGHEITGEIIETGADVVFHKQGDICSVPFNIACGRCRMCDHGKPNVCLNVNPARPGAAYGYVDMGGWIGGQARYVFVPFADYNLLKFPDRDQALEKILDLTMLSDIFPTGYHGAITAGTTTGSNVYVAGAGPVGLAAAHSAQLLGAGVVIVGDMIPERLEQAHSFGCETIDLRQDASLNDMIEQVIGTPFVDAAVDAVGFEARGHGEGAEEAPATVLNDVMAVADVGAALGIPGLYVTGDPGAADENAKHGQLGVQIGLGWSKALAFYTGQCPVKRYNRELMKAILADKAHIAKAVNATVISLEDAPQGYQEFDKGAARKYVIDPHGMIAA